VFHEIGLPGGIFWYNQVPTTVSATIGGVPPGILGFDVDYSSNAVVTLWNAPVGGVPAAQIISVTHTFHLSLTADEVQQLREAAAAEVRSISNYVAHLIARDVARDLRKEKSKKRAIEVR